MTELDELFTREGHVSELSLARLDAGELAPDERAAVEARLAEDPISQALLAELRAFSITPPLVATGFSGGHSAGRPRAGEAVTSLPPVRSRSAPVISVLERRRPRTGAWLAVMGLAAAASAAAWWFVQPQAPEPDPIARVEPVVDEGIRLKGERFAFELWIDDGERTTRARAGDEVHAGDKIGFRVYPREAGHLLILCIDPLGRAQACHPIAGFAAIAPRGDALTITPGLAFDDAPGEERFVALFCAEAPAIEKVLADPDADWPGCERETIAVRKASGP